MSRNTPIKLEISVQLSELGYNNLEIIPIVKKLSAHAKEGENPAYVQTSTWMKSFSDQKLNMFKNERE